jgi:hypothetical protein
MALIDEFSLIYTQHVYGDGLATPEFGANDLTDRNNPRALARAVQYGDHDKALYPHVTGVDGSGYLTYATGTAPSDGALDTDAPRLIANEAMPYNIRLDLIDQGWISSKPLTNIANMYTITDAGILALRADGTIP